MEAVAIFFPITDLLNLGKIFGIEDRATALVAGYEAKLADVTTSVDRSNPLRVFVYDSGEETPFTAGAYAMPTALIEAAGLGGVVGYAGADARTGQVLEGLAEREALPPASTAKAITSLFALERLGPGHRFVTRVLVTGPLRGGRVEGDLILSGSGDPELDTDRLGDLVARLAASGLRGVTGRFLIHDGALPAIDQIAGDQPDHVGYNPAISGLNLNYNRVHFEWKPAGQGWQLAMDARGTRFVPPVAGVKVAFMIFNQGELALKDIDKLIFRLMPVAET